MPAGAYLLAILFSLAGMLVIDRTQRLGILGRRLLVAVVVVEVAFLLVFDVLGAGRGWFASNPDYVVAIVPPGIPPEEPLLLAFLAYFTLVVQGLARRWLGEGGDA
jgi:lycopene cyclase domain-containing protein